MTTQITVAELESQCESVATQRLVVDQISAKKKEADKVLEDLELRVMETLKALDKKSYASKAGNFIISHKLSVKIPQTDAERAAFFQYLKDRGMFETMIGVHSAKLNSFYKEEFEAAKQRGDEDFEIPGILPPTLVETLSVRK